MKWISSEWKNVLTNPDNKDGRIYLYKDSYEFDSTGKLINKWKVNKITNAPKVMFIDEISHYNQQELSMIEQFAKLNGIVVLTAGDLDQDTLTTYFNQGGEDLNVTINRNNFIRTPKLGLSLRSLNKQLTHDVLMMQSVLSKLKEGQNVTGFNFTYLEDDPNHAGLFGVKTTSSLNEETKKTIQTMIDTTTDKIGYIYHDENSELYKYLTDNFKDKINFYKDSEAQGLEGQYYIVENDLKSDSSSQSSASNSRTLQYGRSLYTGISRAEQGVLAFVPQGQFGLIDSVSSIKDPTYQLESIEKTAIKNASEERKKELEELEKEFSSNKITIYPPTEVTSVTTQPISTTPAQKPAGLNPVLPPNTNIPSRIGSGYTSKIEAQQVITYLNSKISNIQNAVAIDNAGEEYEITDTKIVESTNTSGITVYTPTITLNRNNTEEDFSIDDFNRDFTLKSKTTGSIAMTYDIGDKLTIEENGNKQNVQITNRTYTSNSGQPKYVIANLDGSNLREIYQDELQKIFIDYYVENTPTPVASNIVPDNGSENNPEEFASAITSENSTEENISFFANRLGIRIYTFNGFEVGFGFENGQIKYNGSEDSLNARVDNGIGLAKLFGIDLNNLTLDQYNQIKQMLGELKRQVYHLENSDLIDVISKQFRINPNNCHIQYAIKSSDPKESKNFEQYYSDRQLDYIYSDDKDADKLNSKKVVMLIKNGDEVLFELTVGTLSSPLTIMQQLDENGNLKFEEFVKKYNEAIKKGLSNDYEIINYIIDQLETVYTSKSSEYDLLNLFKFYLFNSNGIFYFGHYNKSGEFKPNYNFDLSKCISSGTQLVRERGEHQLNGKFQFNGKFIPLKEFAQNPQYSVSSILVNKDHGDKIKPGYPFVLVSTDPNIYSDNDLVDAYEAGNPSVRMYYVSPPKTSVTNWFLNQHKNYEIIEQSGGSTQVKALVGNEFTGYRILKALINSGKFETLKSFVDFKNNILEAFNTLQNIETKWKETDIQFSGNIIDGAKTDQELYQQYLEIYKNLPDKEQRARERLITLEQLNFLRSINNFGPSAIGISPNATIGEAINKYLRNLVWNEWQKSEADKDVLKEIEDICNADGLTGILHKTFLSSESVGSHSEYTKITTVSGNKYSIQGVDGIVDFEINAKIDPPSFMSEILYQQIEQITRQKSGTKWNDASSGGNIHRTAYFYYDPKSKTWKLTDLSQKFQDDYLNRGESIINPASTIKSELKRNYAKYFSDGLLDESLIDESKSLIENLVILAQAYNQTPGKFGFVYNNQLILTTFDESIILDNPNENIIFNDENIIFGHDSNNVDYKFTIDLEKDINGFVTKVNVYTTKYTYPKSPAAFEGITENDFKTFKDAVEEYNRNQNSGAGKISINLQKIDSLGKLIAYAQELKESQDFVEILALESDSALFNNINSDENFNLLLKVLNYVNSDENFEENNYNIVRYNNQRLLIVNPSQYQILGENSDQPLNDHEFFDLTDKIKDKMKVEEILCNPMTWKIVTKF